MLGATLISPFAVLAMTFCSTFNVSHLQQFMVPFSVGVVTPVIWRRVTNGGQSFCHITPQWLGPMLIHLPASEIVWGVMEMIQGSSMHGSARLVKGIVNAMVIALSLTAGWQVFGRDLASDYLAAQDMIGGTEVSGNTGSHASIPPSMTCAKPFFMTHESGSYFTWPVMFGVYGTPLAALTLVVTSVRPRDWLWPFCTCMSGILTMGYMIFECTAQTCQFPIVVANTVAATAATTVAMLGQQLSGVPEAISIIPAIFIFAPGSRAVLACIGAFQTAAGNTGSVTNQDDMWKVLVQQSLSFGVPIYLVVQCWQSALSAKLVRRMQVKGFQSGASVLKRPDFHNPPALLRHEETEAERRHVEMIRLSNIAESESAVGIGIVRTPAPHAHIKEDGFVESTSSCTLASRSV